MQLIEFYEVQLTELTLKNVHNCTFNVSELTINFRGVHTQMCVFLCAGRAGVARTAPYSTRPTPV
jgi:hypothetical protein